MEANTASQESENRITIGGKRKSSNRRSSILKATKSPLKAGVLEDLDPNSLDDNGRSRSKKSRRSSGRRVSFAEKNDIKEFFVEDWKSSSTKDNEDNLQVPSSASHGEYRAPAESIQGLESLLKGDIQGDDNQLCRAEIQEMPEVQYSQLSAASDNKVSYDRGILLQSVAPTQAQHTVPLDVTICHGPGIIGASQIGHQNPNANLTEQAEEMEYTKCHSSVMPGASTNMDQTRLFGADTCIELDVTCSQQEIFFRDYPDVQLSSPDGVDQSGKMDSKSFLMSLGVKPSWTKESLTSTSISKPGEVTDVQSSMTSKQGSAPLVSNFKDNVEVTACHSYKVLENGQLSSPDSLDQSGKMDSKSFLMSLGAKPSSTKESPTSTSFGNASRKRQPLGEITEVQSSMTSKQGSAQQVSHFDDNVELTACHSYKVLENSVPNTSRRSIYEPANIDVTCCYDAGLMQSPDKQECHGLGETSVCGSQMTGVTLNLNANRNSFGTDLPGQSQPECTAQPDVANCYGSGILPGKKIGVLGVDQTVLFSTDADNTDSLDLTTVCQPQEEHDSDENLELTACHSYEVLDNSIPKTNQKSICEPADLDVTSCYGPGLINSPEKQISSNYGREYAKTSGVVEDLPSPDMCSFRNPYLIKNPFEKKTDVYVQQHTSHFDENVDLTVCHSQPVQDSSLQKTNRRSLYEPTDIDVTSCHGVGLVKSSAENLELSLNCSQPVLAKSLQKANRRSLNEPADIDVTSCYGPGFVTSSGETLESTSCQSPPALGNSSLKTNRQSLYEPNDIDVTSCYGPGLVKSSGENLEQPLPHSQPGLANNTQRANRRSLYEPADIDVTSCYGSGLVKLSGENLEQPLPHSQPGLANNTQRANRQSLYEPADIDVTSCYGTGLIKSPGENLEQPFPPSQAGLASNNQRANRRGLYEPADTDVTSCYGSGLVKSSGENLEQPFPHSQPGLANNAQRANRRSLYEPADIDVTSCYGPGLVKSSGENVEQPLPHSQPGLANNTQRANRRSLYEPADIDVTSCYGSGLVKSSSENLKQPFPHSQPGLANNTQRVNRRSLYEPADIDVTSCYGPGLVKSPGENLEQPLPHSQPGLANNTQRANRRSLYEPADIDVTSCYGSGLVKSSDENLNLTVPHSQPVLDCSNRNANRRSLYEPADVDVTSCHGPGLVKSDENLELTVPHSQPVLDNSAQNTNRRSLHEPADLDFTCHGSELVKSFSENSELSRNRGQQDFDNNSQVTNRRNLYKPADLDVTCHGAELVKSFSENSELSRSRGQQDFDNNSQITNRQSLYKPADLDVTYHGTELVKSFSENSELSRNRGEQDFVNNSQKTNCRRLHEPANVDATSLHGAELVKSFSENSELRVSHSQHADDNIQQAKRQSLSESAGINTTSCKDEEVTSNNDGETALHLTKGPETAFDPEEDVPNSEEILQTSKVAVNSNASFESTNQSDDIDMASSHSSELNKSTDDQMTSNGRKLSMIREESVSELSRKEMGEDANVTEVEDMQNTTQSPITLKEFLDLMEIAFIREVNVRRSIVPPDLVKAPQTPKDKIISSLVSKPKAVCYEEAIPAIEAEIKNMRMKVEEQEMELNASNPRVFMEAQAASKEELLEMQNKVRRLRSTCEKTTKREWKEGKGQLNKRILTKITENHQALASDVHVVEESLSMVDDCFNLLDKMDNELDEGISYNQSIEKNEKKLQEQATMVEQLKAITEALEKSEKELAELENKRTALQSEKQELVNRKEQLDVKRVENEEAIRLLKSKNPRSGNTTTRTLSQKLDILESLQEWSLEEWDKEHARFTFLKNTLELVVVFGSEISDTEGSFSNQEVKNIQLNFTSTEHFTGKMGKVHALVKQAVNQNVLADMCHSKKDLTKVLEHMSEIVLKSNEIGKELFIIGLSHLMSFKENRFIVEFSSLKAFVKFVLHIQLELLPYPDSVTFTVSPMIGHLSQTEIEETLHTVEAGPRYLCRLVEAADQLLNKAKPTSNMPS